MMEQENKDYDGFGDVSPDRFDANETAPQQIPNEEQPKEFQINESAEEEELHDKLGGASAFHVMKSTLVQSAKDGMHHHTILDAIDKHVPKVSGHIEDDNYLNNTLRSADAIDTTTHAKVFNVLSKHVANMQTNKEPGQSRHSHDLINKYSWALHHSPNEIPETQHREDNYLDEDHIKKYSKDFLFRGGRIMSHNIIGSNHYLNHDGTHSVVRGSFDERFPSELPHIDEEFAASSKYHKDELEGLHTPYIKDTSKTEGIVRMYTMDSKHINKTAAEINKGNGDPNWEGRSNSDLDVISMHNAVANAPAYKNKFTVYTGLSKSTDPKQAEESSPGKKTAHMKAFTSTSLSEVTARSFAVPHPKDPEIHQNIHDMLEINVPAGHKGGLYVDRASENSGEDEYVLDHGTRIEHDSKPKYFAHNDRMFRVWKNGNIVGNKKHEDFSIEKKDAAEHTPAYVSRLQQSQLPTHRKWAAASPAASNKHLNTALADSDVSVRYNAAANPNASIENLNKASKDSSYHVAKAAILNPNANKEHLDNAISHSSAELRTAIMEHPLSTKEHADVGIQDPSPYVRAAAVLHPNISKDSLEKATKDKDLTVSRTAKHRLGLLNEEIIELMMKASEILKED